MSDDGKVTSAGPQHAAEAEPTRSSDLAPPTTNLFYSGNGASSLIYSGNGASSVIYSGDGAGSVPLSGGGSAIDVGDGEQPVGVPAIISHGIPVSSNSLYPTGASAILTPDLRSSVSSGSIGPSDSLSSSSGDDAGISSGIHAGSVKSAPKRVAGPYVSPSRQRYLAAAKARAGHITSASACVPHVPTGYSEGLVVTKSPLLSSAGDAAGDASGGVGYISYSGGVPAGSVTSATDPVVSSARSSEEFDDMLRRTVSVHTDAIRAELQEKFEAQFQQLQVDFEQRIHAIQVEIQAQSEVQVRAEIQRIRSGVDEQIRALGGTIQQLSKSSSDNVAIRSELCEHISRLQETTTALSLTMKQTEVKMARKLSIAVARSTEDTAATVDMLKQHLSEAEGRIYDLEQVLF